MPCRCRFALAGRRRFDRRRRRRLRPRRPDRRRHRVDEDGTRRAKPTPTASSPPSLVGKGDQRRPRRPAPVRSPSRNWSTSDSVGQRRRGTNTSKVVSRGVRPELAEVIERHEVGARRAAAGRGGAAAQDRAAHGAGERLRPDRRGHARRVRTDGHRRAAAAPLDGRTDRADAGRRAVGGIAKVDGRSTVVMSYDYTVLAGTQGTQNHRKKDRLFELAERAARAGRVLHRRRRRSTGRHRRDRRLRPRHARVPAVRRTQRARAARRHQQRALLRRQRRHPRLLRRRDRDRRTPTSAWAARPWSRAADSACSRPTRSGR